MAKKRIDMGIKSIIIKDNKFLIMHKYGVKEDLWELPGGRMEFGKLAEETLKREVKEENAELDWEDIRKRISDN